MHGDQAFDFIGKSAFTRGHAGELRYFTNSHGTVIEGDVNGDAVADFQIGLAIQTNLSAADFVL